ncbi:MAG: HDOD domain-containing protein [Deltaproteobacteria bacterium]|nr:HDOD domain-containing protein [Deltaproteobacteria bacterium]
MNQRAWTVMLGKSLKERILKSVSDLPPMPRILHKAQRILGSPDGSLKALGELIESDPALAVKVLRLANSAYYRRFEKVASVHEAAVVLGMRVLGELVTVACSHEVLGCSLAGYGLEADALWRHSLCVAVASRIIAQRWEPASAEEAFSAGLIHDAGKLILDPYVAERKEAFATFLKDGQTSFIEAEKEILGFDHAEIAAKVCEKWHFPKSISKPIRYHHNPGHFGSVALAYIVHGADQMAIWIGMDTDEITLENGLSAFEKMGIGVDEIEPMMEQVSGCVEGIVDKMCGTGAGEMI